MYSSIFDYDDGSFINLASDSMGFGADGEVYLQMDDHMAVDLDSGELHVTSEWTYEDDFY